MNSDEKITLRQLSALVATVEAGSLRKAALRSGQGQPALSAQIAALEALLGLLLFERRATGLVPTSVGREIAAMARQVMDRVAEIAAHGRGGGQRTVALGVGHSIGPYLLPMALSGLHARHPDLRLQIEEGSSDALAEELESGHHDLILTQLPVSDPSVRTEVIFEERLMVMMAADHPLAGRESIGKAELAGERFLTLGRGFAITRMVEGLAEECGAKVVVGYAGTSMDALRIMCAMGRDIAVVPEFYVLSEVREDGPVVARPLAGAGMTRTVVLAWRQTSGHPPEVAALAGGLREVVRARRGDQP